MRISFFHLILAVLAFVCGLAIFFYGSVIPFIRYSMGDFVVVIFIYCSIKALIPWLTSHWLALGVFGFSLTIEVLQYFDVPRYFGTDKVWVQIILGSTFEWFDIAMYAVGLLAVLWLEKNFSPQCNYNL